MFYFHIHSDSRRFPFTSLSLGLVTFSNSDGLEVGSDSDVIMSSHSNGLCGSRGPATPRGVQGVVARSRRAAASLIVGEPPLAAGDAPPQEVDGAEDDDEEEVVTRRQASPPGPARLGVSGCRNRSPGRACSTAAAANASSLMTDGDSGYGFSCRTEVEVSTCRTLEAMDKGKICSCY